MRNLRCGVLAIALLAHRVVGTASFSWLEPPPSTAVSNKETIPSLKISCSDKKTSDILQLDITAVSQTISAQLANGFATFTPFVLTRPGNQNISVILNGVPVLVAHIYVVPDTVDIGYLSYLDGDPTWSDLSLPPLILADVLNEGNQMIPNTTVKMHAYASDCSALVASKSLFQMLQAVEVVAIQGTDCSAPALVITPMTSAFGIPLISGDAGNAQLSNKNAYPMFMRTNPGGNFEALTLISLISYFKWPQIAVVTFTMFPLDDFFYSNLYQQNVRVVVNIVLQSGKSNYDSEMRQIRDSSATIIASNVFNNNAPDFQVLAASAQSFGMWTAPYVWCLTPSSSTDFVTSDKIPTSLKSGHLSFITLPANTNADLLSQIADRVNNDTYLIDRGLSTHNLLDRTHPTTGNGLIANGVAQDLDATLTIFYGLKSLISKRLDITGQTLFDEMLKQDFTGFSGRMRFDTNGDAYASATAGAMALNGTFQSIGTLRPINGSTLYTLDLSSTSSFEWPGGAPFESVPLAFKSVTACPVGFGRYLVGPVYSCIACPRGTYNWMSNNTDICSNCPSGLFCPGGSIVEVSKGQWMRFRNDTGDIKPEVYSCPIATSCCPDGFCEFESCANGFSGDMCSECSEAGFHVFNSKCMDCRQGPGLTLFIMIVISFFCALALIALPFDEAPTVEILFYYFQVTMYIFEPQVNGILSLPGLATFLAVASLNIDMIALDCPMALAGIPKMMLRFFLPALIILNVGIINLLMQLSEMITGARGLFLPYYLKGQSNKLICFRALIVSLTFIVMPLVDASLSLLQCVEFEGKSVLRAVPQVQCYSSAHSGAAAFAIIMLVLLLVVFPLAITFVLYRIKHAKLVTYEHENVSQLQSLFQCLYHVYKPEYYYMLPITIFEKGMISIIFTLLSHLKDTIQLDVYIIILSLTCATRIYWQPYNSSLEAYLNREVSLGILAMIAFRQYTDMWGTSTLLLVEIGFVVFLPLVLHVMRWFEKNYYKHQEKIHSALNTSLVGSKLSNIVSKRTVKSAGGSMNDVSQAPFRNSITTRAGRTKSMQSLARGPDSQMVAPDLPGEVNKSSHVLEGKDKEEKEGKEQTLGRRKSVK